MISTRRCFVPMDGGNIKHDYIHNEWFWKILGIQTNNRNNKIRYNCFGSNKHAQKYEGGGHQVGCNFILHLK